MAVDGDSYSWDQENDPFGKDFFLLPHEEEMWARVEQIADDNRSWLWSQAYPSRDVGQFRGTVDCLGLDEETGSQRLDQLVESRNP